MKDKMNIEWYLPDPHGVAALGPFTIDDLNELISSGKLRTDDYICAPQISGEQWRRVYTFSQFGVYLPRLPICPPPKSFSKGIYQQSVVENKVEQLIVKNETSLFAALSGEVILHNNQQAFSGKVHRIGVERLIAEFPLSDNITQGQTYYLTLHRSPSIPTFTCQVAVLSRKTEENILLSDLYYIRLNPDSKKKISEFLREQSRSE